MNEYQKYQLEWMISHGFSLQDLMTELTKLQYDDPENSDTISTPVSELFDEWVSDIGFDSEIWACEDEWNECERSEARKTPDGKTVDKLWSEFGDIPMNPDTECIEAPWHGFSEGTNREDIWHWFEDTFDVRVYDLMYGK